MKIRNTFLWKSAAMALIAAMILAGTVFAAETEMSSQPELAVTEADAVEEPAAEPESETAAEPEMKTYGTDSEDAVKFELTNKTGRDITYFSIRVDDGTDVIREWVMVIQEALIEQGYLDDIVDGSYGPKTKAAVKDFREKNGLSAEDTVDEEMLTLLLGEYDDGNILDKEDVIMADETVVIYFLEEPDSDKEQDPEPEEADRFQSYTNYIAEVKFADDETEYTLHSLALEGETMQILLAEDVLYIEYQAGDTGSTVSTYETENAILHPYVPVYDDYYYDDYDDYGYYYYEEPEYNYEQPAENEAQGADGCIADDALTW